MPDPNQNPVLYAVLYAALTGIINLVFSRKSQIEAYALANPRLAAFGKLLRSVGFDPQNFWAFLTLLIKKDLPAAQRSDSVVALREEIKAEEKAAAERIDRMPPPPAVLVLLVATLSLHQSGCAAPFTAKRCDFQNPEYTAHVAMCRQEIVETCLLNEDETPRDDCPALVRCEQWRKEQCQ